MTVLLSVKPEAFKDAVLALQCVIRDGPFGVALYSDLADVAISLPKPILEKPSNKL